MKYVLFAAGLLLFCTVANAQITIPLYPDNQIPNATTAASTEHLTNDSTVLNVSVPMLSVYATTSRDPKGKAVIIFPGGGYGGVVLEREGRRIARSFVRQGITAIVVKYRLPSDLTMQAPSIGPIQDAQQAIAVVKQHAAAWLLDTAKIGILGFSAGGHLAGMAGTRFDTCFLPAPPAGVSLRPAFMVLVYPVVSMKDSIGHMGSRNNLLGSYPSQATIALFSNELHVRADTPPTWIVHASNDKTVPIRGSELLYAALLAHGVPAQLQVLDHGGHGFAGQIPDAEWLTPIITWVQQQ